MSFYAHLPNTVRPQIVGIVNERTFRSMLPRRGFASFTPFGHWQGSYFDVIRRDPLVVKTSHSSLPFIDEFYKHSPLMAEARSLVDTEAGQIKEAEKASGQSITEAYLRAAIDQLNFIKLCKSIPNENMVEQSAFVVWNNGVAGKRLNTALVQPFVFGINFGHMFDRSVTHLGIDRIQSKFERFLPFIGTQMRVLLEHRSLMDFYPLNFIFTGDHKLVYTDYQPVTDAKRASINARSMDNLVSSWGY